MVRFHQDPFYIYISLSLHISVETLAVESIEVYICNIYDKYPLEGYAVYLSALKGISDIYPHSRIFHITAIYSSLKVMPHVMYSYDGFWSLRQQIIRVFYFSE